MKRERSKDPRVVFLIDVAYWAVIVAIIFLVFKYLIRLLMPFFLALVFAALVRPLSHRLSRETKYVRNEKGEKVLVRRKFRMNRTVAGIVSVLLLFAVMGAVLLLLGLQAADTVTGLITAIPKFYENSVVPGINRIYERALEYAANMDPSVKEALTSAVPNLISSVGSFVTNFSARAVTWLTSLATRLPTFLLNTMICLIATVFISVDFDRIKVFIRKNMPEKPLRIAIDVKNSFLDMVWQFVKSYFIIFVITFVELSIGLWLIRVGSPFAIALIIAVMDAFPIVGSGLVLIPWSAASLIAGSYAKGLELLVLYILMAVLRQIIEPRIVGKHVGLRPLVTLICMYAGTRLFGGMGLFALPIAAAILTDLNNNGVIQIFRGVTDAEEERSDEPEAV